MHPASSITTDVGALDQINRILINNEKKLIKFYQESDFFIGLSRYHSGQYTLSADHFQKIISNNPLSPWFDYSKLYAAKSLIKLGKPNDAERLLKSVEGEPRREARKILYLNNV